MTQFVCPSCVAVNRVSQGRDARHAKCGKCHQTVLTGAPVEVTSAELQAHRDGTKSAALLHDVWAPWCGPCRSMAAQFAAAAMELEPDVRLLKLNSEAEPAAASGVGGSGIAAVVLVRVGVEVAQTAGFAIPASQIVNWARQTLTQAAVLAPTLS